ncbi:MAG: hypothetical protein VW455_12890 [Nitrospinota bacterium]
MSFFLITVSLAAVVGYILWVLFKPKKKPAKKKAGLKRKADPKKVSAKKKQEALASVTDQIRNKKTDLMKKDPETISRVVRLWLNEK